MDKINYDETIVVFKTQAKITVNKTTFITSESVIKYMEEDLVTIE
jgi:hypothetical protein